MISQILTPLGLNKNGRRTSYNHENGHILKNGLSKKGLEYF
jgi:hypothetical protein